MRSAPVCRRRWRRRCSAPGCRRRCSAPGCDRRRAMYGHKVPVHKKTLHVRSKCGFRQKPHLDRTSRPKKNHRGDLAGGGITSQHRKTGADNSAPSSGADNPARKTRRANGEEAVFYRCSLALTRGSRLRHTLSPLEARRVGAPRRVGARASRRRTERRGSTAQRAIPPPLLDLGHRPVGWGTRRHLRRHAVVRRESPRCQTSCAPDGHALGGGGAQGCASARGLRRGFGGFTGGLRAARLMAGPAVAAGGRHETSVERLAPSLAGEWDRVGRTSRVACIVCVRRSCGTSLFSQTLGFFWVSAPSVQPAPRTGAEDLGAGCMLGAICAVVHDH